MIEIYDCTPREGPQTGGASLSLNERVTLIQELDKYHPDYIEIGWPMQEDVIASFQKLQELGIKSKLVVFGSTSKNQDVATDINLQKLIEIKVKYICIVGKTNRQQVEEQLSISKKENLERIFASIKFLVDQGKTVFYDAEHYFDGFEDDKEYALETLVKAIEGGAKRLVLCDTRGGMTISQVQEIVKETYEYLKNKNLVTNESGSENEVGLGVHFHNDRGLALVNSLNSIPFIKMVQGTINGSGERAGNLNLSVFLGNCEGKTNVELKKLTEVYEESCRLLGITPFEGTPFVGKNVFTHVGGLHQNAILKIGPESYEFEGPEKYGNKRIMALTTQGGGSSVIASAKQFGIELDKKSLDFRSRQSKLFEELKKIEGQGYDIGTNPAEQYLLIARHFKDSKELFRIKIADIKSRIDLNEKERSSFYTLCQINGQEIDDEVSVEGGPIDAAFKALKNILSQKYPQVKDLHLANYKTRLADQSEEQSVVRTEVWFRNGEKFSMVGVDPNIIYSGVKALAKGFQYHIQKKGQV